MKKIFFTTACIYLTIMCMAQTDNSGVTLLTNDQVLPRLAVDVNLLYGNMSQNIAMTDMLQAYTGSKLFNTSPPNTGTPPTIANPATPSYAGKVTFKSNFGQSVGSTFQAGYFFDKKKMFGVGIGINYMELQKGTLSMDSLNVNYQSRDSAANTFRQYVHASNITETISTSSFTIPIVAKFKHQFRNSTIGVSADAGALINIATSYTSSVATTNSLNYEAIYKVNPDGVDVFETSATPANTDWLLTQEQYISANGNTAGMQSYFNLLRSEGYNVGLNQAVTHQDQVSKYSKISLGLIGQAAVTYQLNYNITATLGGYCMYQEYHNTGNGGYRITDTVGHYNSMLNGVKTNGVMSYGLTLGLRIFIGGSPDKDHDGTTDKEDACPDKPGPGSTNGCPDHDRDGVADKDDHCPDEPGMVSAFGCPDEDYDGVPDHDERLPGYFDRCPDVPGLVKYEGCPDSLMWFASIGGNHVAAAPDSSYIKFLERKIQNGAGELRRYIVLSANTVYFKKGETGVQSSMHPVLDAVYYSLEKNSKLIIYLSGFADAFGSSPARMQLSVARAEAVKKYFVAKGVNADRIKISDNGKPAPSSNDDAWNEQVKIGPIELQLLLPLE